MIAKPWISSACLRSFSVGIVAIFQSGGFPQGLKPSLLIRHCGTTIHPSDLDLSPGTPVVVP